MKKIIHVNRIFAAMLCMIMMLGILPTSVFAAKEMFTTNEIKNVAITGINVPKAGERFDFTVEENSQKYNVVKVAWRQQYSDNYITNESSTATAGIVYVLHVILETATPNHYFATDSGRTSTVTGTVNGNPANVDNAIDRILYSTDASKYEFDTVHKRYVRVTYTFPPAETTPVESFNIKVKIPEPGQLPASKVVIDTVNGMENKGYINVDKVEWTTQFGDPMGDKFEFGETYILSVTLTALYGREFPVDPTNILSTKENPMPKVNVTVNGASASAFPTYDGKSPTETIEVRYVFRLTEAKKISEIEIDGFSAPKTGSFPSYVAIMPVGVDLADTDSGTSKNGITWIEAGSSAVPTFGYTFAANTVYIVKLELEAEKGYEFDDPTVKIDGKTCEVDGDENKITVTYAFQPTGLSVVSSVNIENLDLPENGASPDYTATVTDNRLSIADDNDRFTKNGITWYNVTDDKTMTVGIDKFEKDKSYEVYIRVITGDGVIFNYTSGKCNTTAAVWNKLAETEGRSDDEVMITARYTVTDEASKPDDKKPDGEKPDVTKPDDKKPDVTKPDDTKADTRKVIEKVTVTGVEIKDPDAENPLSDAVKATPANVNITDFNWDQIPVGTWKPGIANIQLETDEDSKFTANTVVRINGYYAKFVSTTDNIAIFRVTFEDVFKESPEEHIHNPHYAYTAFEHYLECACGNVSDFNAHSYDSDSKCQICSYKKYDVTKLPFTDVKADDYFATAVAWAFDKGVTTGISETLFAPDMTCTRGQVVTFLWRAAGCPEPKTTKNPFKDVTENDYFYKAVLWAVENKITNGTSAKEFSPEITCSTAHILTFLFRALEIGKDGWYQEAADWAAYNDLLLSTNLEVNPETPCPRAAVVTFLYRIYG